MHSVNNIGLDQFFFLKLTVDDSYYLVLTNLFWVVFQFYK